VLETLSKLYTVVLDKTGTVTRGDFRLVEFATKHANVEELAMCTFGHGESSTVSLRNEEEPFLKQALPLLAGIETYSEHLLGRAVLQFARDHNIEPLEAESIEIHKGQGISGVVNGCRVAIGNKQLMFAIHAVENRIARLTQSGKGHRRQCWRFSTRQ